jgi:predicted O-methyltransferase YrrM
MSNDSNFFPENDRYLEWIEKKAQDRHIPIISREVGELLRLIIRIKKPLRILEIGTAIGYSTIWMAKAVGKGIEVVTIEKNEDRINEAINNFIHYGIEKQINIKIGDAIEILPSLQRKFELVFIDAAKGQYQYYLDYVLEILPVGGIIIADNVLYKGLVFRKQISHKSRTMVRNLKRYLYMIDNHPLLESTVLSIDDGVAISIRRK